MPIDAPLLLAPVAVGRPWGGARALQGTVDPSVVGDALPDGPIGEWWLVSARSDHASPIVGGSDAGRTLREVLDETPERIFGPCAPAAWSERFPLLVKILDSADTLSVQVHPSDGDVAGEGKTESWLVLDAADDAELFLGLDDDRNLESFFEAAERGDGASEHLARYPAEAGQLAHLPAGRIHALGRGVVALEVQQNSDTTYRIYDWDRTPRRELHLDQARQVASGTQHAIFPTPRVVQDEPFRREILVTSDAYDMERLTIAGEASLASDRDRFHVVVPLDGTLHVGHEGIRQTARKGQAVLVPGGGVSYALTPDDGASTVLRMRPAL